MCGCEWIPMSDKLLPAPFKSFLAVIVSFRCFPQAEKCVPYPLLDLPLFWPIQRKTDRKKERKRNIFNTFQQVITQNWCAIKSFWSCKHLQKYIGYWLFSLDKVTLGCCVSDWNDEYANKEKKYSIYKITCLQAHYIRPHLKLCTLKVQVFFLRLTQVWEETGFRVNIVC